MLTPGRVLAIVWVLAAATLAGCTTTESTPASVRKAAQSPPNPGPLIPYTPVTPAAPAAATTATTSRTGVATPIAAAPTATPRSPAQPAAAPAPKPPVAEFTANPALRDIHFEFDRYDIRPVDAEILDQNVKWMQANPQSLLLIEGHCDQRGTPEYNLALGERRARAALDYLSSKGVQASRMTIVSYGKEKPLCQEQAEACWTKNRRAQFLVKGK